MEKGFESWFQNQQIDWQSTNPNSLSPPFSLPHRLNVASFGNILSSNVAARKPEEQLPEPQKKFLVFDQSNDRTMLIYSSTPMQYHLPKQQRTFNLRNEIPVIEKHEEVRCSNLFHDEGNDAESEMHEDSEELMALLYSDDDEIDYSEDEEEQSTGHFPGFENAEEVASSTGCRKRRKLDSGGYGVDSFEDTASSGKSGVNCSGEGGVSSSGDNSGAGNGIPDVGSEAFPADKRSRKEKVRETISILQNLIPGGKNGKDTMVILDEAIDYLRILKVKAKALGLDSL